MKEEKAKPTKKKILMYYLVLAACLLVIAAITVGVVFAVKNNNKQNLTVDSGNEAPDDGGEEDDGDVSTGNETPDDGGEEDDGGSTNTSSQYEFIVPVREVNLTQAHVFAYDKTLDRYCLHEGMDFSAQAGAEVLAALDGIVTGVYTDDQFYGGYITIEHADGVKTVYKFVDPVEGLTEGASVSRGQVIATVAAATGVENAEGDHLHFEVFKNGTMQDPDDYLNIIGK